MTTVQERYEMYAYKAKPYTGGSIPVGSIIRTKGGNYFLIGDLATSDPGEKSIYWTSAGCSGCASYFFSESDIESYIDLFEMF